MERIGSIPATALPAAMAPAKASSEPTERSIPAPIMTTVMPKASSALTDICLSALVTLPIVRKRSERKERTTVMAMNASSRPNLPKRLRHLPGACDMGGHLLGSEWLVQLDLRPAIAEDQDPVAQAGKLLGIRGGDDDGEPLSGELVQL